MAIILIVTKETIIEINFKISFNLSGRKLDFLIIYLLNFLNTCYFYEKKNRIFKHFINFYFINRTVISCNELKYFC